MIISRKKARLVILQLFLLLLRMCGGDKGIVITSFTIFFPYFDGSQWQRTFPWSIFSLLWKPLKNLLVLAECHHKAECLDWPRGGTRYIFPCYCIQSASWDYAAGMLSPWIHLFFVMLLLLRLTQRGKARGIVRKTKLFLRREHDSVVDEVMRLEDLEA